MNTPPATGPSAMGTRRTSETSETPIVRFVAGSTWASNSIVAGREIADHDRNRIAPPITAGQRGTRTTSRYPAIETKLNTRSDRLVPSRSDRYPPGKE